MNKTEARRIGATCLALHVRRAARQLGRHYDDALRPVGLSNGQFSLLTMLAAKDGWQMQALADFLGLDQSSLTAALKPLLRRGLASVATGAKDRRTRHLKLTEPGRAALAEAEPLWRAAQARAEALLGQRSADEIRRDLRALS